MDFVRKYMLSTAMLRSPDGDGAVVDPPAIVDPPVDPALAADPPADPTPEPARNQPPKWALDRISAETAKREESDRQRDAAERRAADAEALAARLQAGANPDPAPRPAPPAQNIDQMVNDRAQQIRLNEDSTAIKSAGLSEFGAAFGETLAILNAVGAVSDDIVLNMVAVDKANAHKILTTLAKDPEKAASFAKLDSRRQIAELTRMSDALKADPKPVIVPAVAPAVVPKTGSKAPPPAPPVDPSASKTIDWRSDEASDDDFSKGWNERQAQRARR